MMKYGISLNLADGLRPLLERSGHAMTESHNLKSIVPKVEAREIDLLVEEHKDQYPTFIFDGTPRLGDVTNVCSRFVPKDFSEIVKRGVAVKTTEKQMNGVDLAKFVTQVATVVLRIPAENVVMFGRDGCATNGVACRALVVNPFTSSLHTICASHTLHKMGEKLELDVVELFLTPFLFLLSHCHALVNRVWKEITGLDQGIAG